METNIKNDLTKTDLENIKYIRCSEVDIDFVYKAFTIGFSDYIVKFELTKEQFVANFFGPEGNHLEHSFVAIHENEAVGVILGGIKEYENMKTMRCGTLAISPNYRGKGVSQKLFDLHKAEAKKHGCKQLFLEVIVGNDRAIQFYKNLGYEKIYDISYFSKKDLSDFEQLNPTSECEVHQIEYNSFTQIVNKWNYHINWQNDVEYLEKAPNVTYFEAYIDQQIVGAIAVHASGKISFLYVDQNYRNQKIATKLLQTAFLHLECKAFSTGFPNNSHLEGFLTSLGFQKEKLAQYEMYKRLV
ncbi:GNAT family N-acetyltransferase [Gottfriedia solisilvae]|uniref:GNAT family N-acetyltransferase n=1 Tax=Gottfriedia solisilvae TaxID=1516104 RepID=UPI003D2EB315